jgi:hypothetical protein
VYADPEIFHIAHILRKHSQDARYKSIGKDRDHTEE